MRKVLMITLSVFVFIVAIAMGFPNVFFKTSAEGDGVNERYSLISTLPEYYNNAESLYGISAVEKETYTPFNKTSNLNMDGWSFSPTQNSYGEINSEYQCLSNSIDLTDKSLFIWIYFAPGVLPDTLKITLKTTTSTNVKFELSASELTEILTKNDVAFEEGFSWNLLEFPITTTGEYSITSITFTSSSQVQQEDVNICDINIYDVYIKSSETNYINAKIKQRMLDWDTVYPANLNNLYLNSSIKPSVTMANNLKYAFYGKYNLLTESTAVWKLCVKYNGGEPSKYDLGKTITFDEEGSYILYYECTFAGKKLVANPVAIQIEKFVGIYFNNPSYSKLEVGKSYLIDYTINNDVIPTSDITLEYNQAYIDAQIIEEGKIKIIIKKKGTTTIKAKVTGLYVGSPDPVDFEANAMLKLTSAPVDNFYIFKTFGVLFLALVGVAIIIFIVKSFVKSRKIDVK